MFQEEEKGVGEQKGGGQGRETNIFFGWPNPAWKLC